MTPIPPIQARRSAADRASDDAGTRHRDLDYSGSVFLPWCRTTVGLLATIVAALAVGAPAAFAAPNEIAYRCGADICLLDPDNPSNVTNLTNNGLTSLEETPVWSPDGTYIAFISRLNGTRNVYVMNPTPGPGVDVTVARRITPYTDGGFLGEPAWSPDGSKIAFVRGTAESNRSISVAAADGTTGTPPLIAEHGEHPSWSPDGGKITYAYQRQIFTKDADGTGFADRLRLSRPRAGISRPACRPGGWRVAGDHRQRHPVRLSLLVSRRRESRIPPDQRKCGLRPRRQCRRRW